MSKLRVVLDGAAEMVPRAIGITGDTCGGKLRMLLLPTMKTWVGIWRSKKGVLWGTSTTGDSPQTLLPPEPGDDPESMLKVQVRLAQSFAEDDARVPKHRGVWRGTAVCDPASQRVTLELRRAITSYGEVVVTSDPSCGWKWRYEGKPRWFQIQGPEAEGELTPHDEIALKVAIPRALGQAELRVAMACTLRDGFRRESIDHEYQAIRPLKLPRDHFRGVERPKIQPMVPQAPGLNWSGLLHRWTELPFAGPAPAMRRIDTSSPAKDRDDVARSLVRALPVGVGPDWAIGVLTHPWHRWPRGTIVARPPGNAVQWMYARSAEEALADKAPKSAPADKAPKSAPADKAPKSAPAHSKAATRTAQSRPGLVTARAQVTGLGMVVVMDGPYRESTFKTYEPVPPGARVVQIEFHPDDQLAHIVPARPAPAASASGEFTARAQVTGSGFVVVLEGPHMESEFLTYEPIPPDARTVMIRFNPEDQYAHIVDTSGAASARPARAKPASAKPARAKPASAKPSKAEGGQPGVTDPSDRQLLLEGFRQVLKQAPDLEK